MGRAPGTAAITSTGRADPTRVEFVDEVGVVLESFGPERITSANVEPPDREVPFRQGQLLSIVGQARVGDRIPCHAGPLTVTTETPSVCAGPQGEESWEAEWYERFSATAIASGTCQLVLSLVGGSIESEVATQLNVQ